ncbi:L-serine ammonia-lyase [Planctomycetaceae bacterium SH139]
MFSVFDLFKLGIGPSSSHTVGPMRAAGQFLRLLQSQSIDLSSISRVQVDLYGSLALTGRGHATDRAVVLGLSGYVPESVPSEIVSTLPGEVFTSGQLLLAGEHSIPFADQEHLRWHCDEALPRHPNALRLRAFDLSGAPLCEETYYSVGGGFVVSEVEAASGQTGDRPPLRPLRFPFKSASELLTICSREGLRICQVAAANELSWRDETETNRGIDAIWQAMRASIERGCQASGELPGGLRVQRRAAAIRQRLDDEARPDGLEGIDWLSLFALAVNEENAAGHRVVTAPTNGAAGVIPAVLAYYEKFFEEASQEGIRRFLLTATAIGSLYKHNASLSAAEVGCQGEVGVASSMAAAGLAEAMGGTPRQIENAAEIAMEHHLGMTCDPIGGLVQVPCIERNAIGAVKAVNAARLAVLYGDGTHRVALDGVIDTMRQTGVDMAKQYKETSLGGLALHVGLPEC